MLDAHIALEGEVGSVAHGLGLPTSDHDLMRVEVETLDSLIGLSPVPSTQRIRPRLEGEKSQQDDIEITVYPVRKYLSLAMDGNPNVIPLMWTSNITYKDRYNLRSLRTEFITKKLAYAHLGFANNMLMRLEGTKAPRVNREELVDEHGYDTKSAYHAVRVLTQALELAVDQYMPMPMRPHNVDKIMRIRSGEAPVEEVKYEIKRISEVLKSASVDLPETTDVDTVNQWLFELYGVI